jgi:hypothetical protein
MGQRPQGIAPFSGNRPIAPGKEGFSGFEPLGRPFSLGRGVNRTNPSRLLPSHALGRRGAQLLVQPAIIKVTTIHPRQSAKYPSGEISDEPTDSPETAIHGQRL